MAGAFALPPLGALAAEQEGAGGAGAIAVWAGKNLASKVAGKAGEMAFAQVLSLCGFPSGDQQILSKLDQISQQLDQMNRTMIAIESRVQSLERQLTVTEKAVEVHVSEEALKTSINALNRLFGSAGDRGTGDYASLASFMTRAREEGPVDATPFRQRAGQSAQRDVTAVHDGLTTTFAGNKSLLEQWVDLLIAKLQVDGHKLGEPNRQRLMQSYVLFENYFMQAVSAQLKGVAVQAACLTSFNASAPAPVAEAGTEAALRQARGNFASMFHAQAERFVWCTDRLVMSQLTPASDADATLAMTMFTRADLLTTGIAAILAGQNGDTETLFGGTYGRILVPPSVRAAPGPAPGAVTLTLPAPAGQKPLIKQIAGTLADYDTGVPCVDWAPAYTAGGEWTGPYFEVRPARESIMRLIRVKLPAGSVAPSALQQMLPSTTPYIPPVRPLDVVTLETVQQPSPTTVRAGAYLDRSLIERAYPVQDSQFFGLRPEPIEHEGQNPNLLVITPQPQAARMPVLRPPQYAPAGLPLPAVLLKFRMKTSGQLANNQTSVKQTWRMALFQTGETQEFAAYFLGSLSDTAVPPLFSAWPKTNHHVVLSIVGSDGSSTPAYDSKGSAFDTWDRGRGSVLATTNGLAPFTAAPNVTYDLLVTVTSTAGQVPITTVDYTDEVTIRFDSFALVRPPGAGIEL